MSAQLVALRLALRAYATVNRRDVPTLSKSRSDLDAFGSRLPVPSSVRIMPSVVDRRPAEVLTPPGASAVKAILFLHGGAYTAGSLRSHRGLAGHIAAGAAVTTTLLDYRLAPEHPFPAALDDAEAAFISMTEATGDPQRIAVVGDSAGGGLAAALALRLRDRHGIAPACLALISPWIDLTGNPTWDALSPHDFLLTPAAMRRSADDYLAGHDPRDPAASPAFGELAGLPPTLVHIAGDELLKDDTVTFVERLHQAGVEVQSQLGKRLFHDWHLMANVLPEARTAVHEAGQFLRHHLR